MDNIGDLTLKTCRACEGYDNPMSLSDINSYIKKVKGWDIEDNGRRIRKEYEFRNFKKALEFVNEVGKLAEEEAHHPDIYLHSYKKVRIDLTTHAIKGLSENDFIVASKVDGLYQLL